MNTKCRRCSECPDAKHHWLPECHLGEEPYWCCKHCDYRCESVSCEACGEEVPIDIAKTDSGEDHVFICQDCAEEGL